MSKTITFGLSVESIEQAIAELEKYKADFKVKCEQFIRALLAEGIAVAKTAASGTEYGMYLSFTASYNGLTGTMSVSNTGIIHSEWLQADGSTKSADVSPLLMAEFGAGALAQNPKNVPGVGRGTFPGQTHAFEAGWWYATGTPQNKEWHYSTGVSPSQPVYKAYVEMYKKIDSVAKRVFK